MAGTWVSQTGFAGTKTLVRSGRAIVSSVVYINTDAAARFCQIFDAAAVADVTVGTTAPTLVLGTGTNGTVIIHTPASFLNGIVVAGTTTPVNSTGAAAGSQNAFFLIE